MKLYFVLLMLSISIFGCDNVKTKYSLNDIKKSSLRYFITINYSSIANEMFFGEDEYVKSLYSEIASFEKNIDPNSVRNKFFMIQDPFDFAVSVTKELD